MHLSAQKQHGGTNLHLFRFSTARQDLIANFPKMWGANCDPGKMNSVIFPDAPEALCFRAEKEDLIESPN